jgi:hypothetical protein
MKTYKPNYTVQRKKVFKSSEIEHIWAQQKISEGRCGNVFFEGPSIFSYGRHFEMARFISGEVVLITTRRYSVTTSSHLHAVRMAVDHLTTFEVPTFEDHKANALGYITDIQAELYRISRMRSDPTFWLKQYRAKVQEAAQYAALFQKQIGAAQYRAIHAMYEARLNPLTKDQMAKLKAQAVKDRERTKAAREARELQYALEQEAMKKSIEDWARGEDVRRSFHDVPVRLRVKDNEIQTSRGASVPLIEARKLWHTLQTKQPIEGMRVGHYTVTEIRDGALIVGCHVIPLREVYKMAQALNWGTFELEVA